MPTPPRFLRDNPIDAINKVVTDAQDPNTRQGQIATLDVVGNVKVLFRGARNYTPATLIKGLTVAVGDYVICQRSEDSTRWLVISAYKGGNPLYRASLSRDLGCRIRNNTGGQNTNSATPTVITFDTNDYDTDNMHSTSYRTSRITIAHAGKYTLWASIDFVFNATGTRTLQLRLNGVTQIANEQVAAGNSDTQVSVSIEYQLAAGDYVEVLAVQTSGGVLAVNSSGLYSPVFGARKIDGTGTIPQNIPAAGSGNVTLLTTKGDLFTFDTGNQRLGVGATRTVLMADPAQATGLRWGQNPILVGASIDASTVGATTPSTGNFTALTCTGNASSPASNTALGLSALAVNTIDGNNVAVGKNALLLNTTGFSNTAVGGAGTLGSNVSGAGNTAIGYGALNANTVGGNTAVGFEALFVNSTGTGHTAVGYAALNAMQTNINNTAVGYQALTLSVADWNTAVGYNAMLNNTIGGLNTALGAQSMNNNLSGGNNTAVGVNALLGNSDGSNNVAIGLGAGYTGTPANGNVHGGNNTWLGYGAGPASTTQLNETIAIGFNALVNASFACVIGGTGVDEVLVGSGLTVPTVKLHMVKTNTDTNVVLDLAILCHNSSGVIAPNFGTALRFQGQSSTTASRDMARLRTFWSVATDASRAAQATLSAFDTAERDCIGWGASGTVALLGFYNIASAPIAQPTTGVASATFVVGAGTAINTLSTFDGYTLPQIVKGLRNLGAFA